MNEEQSKQRAVLNVKNIMRILALLCIIFVFCPAFLVSCSGQTMKVSVMTAVGGVSAYGEQLVDPYPILLICLVLPVVMLVLLFVRTIAEKITAVSVMICSLVDTIIWFVFRIAVKKVTEQNYCTFKTTVWFVINIISLVVIVVLSVLVLLKKVEMETDLVASLSGKEMQDKFGKMSEMVNSVVASAGEKKVKSDVIGYCAKCGAEIEYGNKFCTACGTVVPESMIEEAEERRRLEAEAEENHLAEENDCICKQCGAKVDSDSAFCVNCGTKIE